MAKPILSVLAIAGLLTACSSRPREFRAELSASAPDVSVFDREMRQCQILVRGGIKKDFKRTIVQTALGSGVGYVAGLAVSSAVISGVSATSLSSAINGVVVAGSAGAAASLAAGPLVAFGVSRVIRQGGQHSGGDSGP